jgi:hypothetical protein
MVAVSGAAIKCDRVRGSQACEGGLVSAEFLLGLVIGSLDRQPERVA